MRWTPADHVGPRVAVSTWAPGECVTPSDARSGGASLVVWLLPDLFAGTINDSHIRV